MGCGCNKGKNTQRVAENNPVKSEAKQRNIELPKKNNPSFPAIPQLQRSRLPESSRTDESEKKVEVPEQPKFGEKIKNFGKSVTSRITQGKAEDHVIKLRVLSCHGDENVLPCPYRADSTVRNGAKFCTACGCGDKPRAFLNNPDDPNAYTKLHYPWVSCPVKMPGFSDYVSVEEQPKEISEKYAEAMDRKKLIENKLKEEGIEIPAAIPLPEKK